MCHRGMMKAPPEDERVESQEMAPSELGAVLAGWARASPPVGVRQEHTRPGDAEAREGERRKGRARCGFQDIGSPRDM